MVVKEIPLLSLFSLSGALLRNRFRAARVLSETEDIVLCTVQPSGCWDVRVVPLAVFLLVGLD